MMGSLEALGTWAGDIWALPGPTLCAKAFVGPQDCRLQTGFLQEAGEVLGGSPDQAVPPSANDTPLPDSALSQGQH